MALDREEQKKSGGKGIIAVLIIVVVLILGGALLYFSFSDGGPKHVLGFEFIKPDKVLVGEPFKIAVSLTNPSDKILKEVRFIVELPAEFSFLGQSQEQRVREWSVGDLGPGSVNQETVELIAVSGPQSVKAIAMKAEYQTTGSKIALEEKSSVDVAIGESIIGLNITSPSKVSNGEKFEVKLAYQNNSNQDIKKLSLKAEYPPVFKFQKASEDPDRGNNIWELGGLLRGAKAELSVMGSMLAAEKSSFDFRFVFTSELLGQKYTIVAQPLAVSIAPSSFTVSAILNDDSDYIAKVGDHLDYTINYRNSSDITLQDVTVTAALTGELFNYASARGNAFFNSITNTFSWTVANTPALQSLAPGTSGSVDLRIDLKREFPITRLNDKNFLLKLNARVESPTVIAGTAAEKSVSVTTIENKVAGDLRVDARGYFWDAVSGIANSGPYPPRVNQPTQYTIHWIVSAHGADMSSIDIATFLQSGARWTGKVKSNIESLPTYEPTSGRVTWHIDKFGANKGVLASSPPAEAIFQIEVTPAVNQVGGPMTLIAPTTFQGHDDFSGLTVSGSDREITSVLPDDPSIQGLRNVQP
ncbi:MAG: hypothetical protein AAB652_02090 [Patescibacteria group bacterium]